jgi:hypothetical protein
MLTSLSKVRLPGMTSTISISFVVLLVVIAELSLPDAVVIASLQTAVQCVWKTGRRPDPVQVFFSMASVVLSTALGLAAATPATHQTNGVYAAGSAAFVV